MSHYRPSIILPLFAVILITAFLVAKGISADRIAAKGYGPDHPVAPNTTKEGKQKNRRIEFFRTK